MVHLWCCCFESAVSFFPLFFLFLIWVILFQLLLYLWSSCCVFLVVFFFFCSCLLFFSLVSSFLAFGHFLRFFSSSSLWFSLYNLRWSEFRLPFFGFSKRNFCNLCAFRVGTFFEDGSCISQKTLEDIFFVRSLAPIKHEILGPKTKVKMLAKVTLRCWPSYVIFLGAEDGQHFNFKNAWFCRGMRSLKKTLNLASILNPTTYIYMLDSRMRDHIWPLIESQFGAPSFLMLLSAERSPLSDGSGSTERRLEDQHKWPKMRQICGLACGPRTGFQIGHFRVFFGFPHFAWNTYFYSVFVQIPI